MKNFLFFLGGHDAEMCEIRSILEQNSLPFYDKKLSWGSALSSYKDELSNIRNKTPVFIELKLDISYPDKAIIVDHHNKKSGENKPTSIEQVAELLNIKLTRRQMLIAANDRAHIPGMLNYGAKQKEIEEIRVFDRKCQGVTEEEEQEAEKICTCFISSGQLDIIEIPFLHTSPVTDRLFGKYRNLLIITPESFNFYGDGKLIKILAEAYPESWYGGNLPEEGFWGLKNNRLLKNDILSTLGKIQ